jgi:hypothetical protein
VTPTWLANIALHEFTAGIHRRVHPESAYDHCGAATAEAFDRWCLRQRSHSGDHSAVAKTAAGMDRIAAAHEKAGKVAAA